jgi:hypothetical protein
MTIISLRPAESSDCVCALVSASGAAISGDTIMGALGSFDGTTNRLVLTTPGTMSPVNVSGFQSYQLANGGLNSLTLSETNFARLPGGSISVIGGDSGNTVNAGSLSAAHGVVVSGGAGTDKFTGGSGNDRFVFTPSSLGPNDTADGGAGNNTLELAAGGSGVLSGLGTSFVNIGTVLLDTNAVWTIGISNPAGFTGMISGLSPRDSLDLPFMSFSSSGTAMLGLGNVLQISENGSTAAINLDPNQSFTGDIFRLAPDSGGGTLVFEVLAGAPDAPVVFGPGLPGAPGAPVAIGSGLPGASDAPVVIGSGLPGAPGAPVVIGPTNFNVTAVPGGDLMLTAQPIPETFDFGSWVFNAEIAGFDPTQDTILLSSSLAGSFTSVQANMSPLGGSTLITFDASHSLTLDGIQQGSLSAANFRFT